MEYVSTDKSGPYVAKQIAHFEYNPTPGKTNNMRRQDAVKRRNFESEQSSSASSTISSSSDSEIQVDDFTTSSSSPSSLEFSDCCYERCNAPLAAMDPNSNGIYQSSSDDYEAVATNTIIKVTTSDKHSKLTSTKRDRIKLKKDCCRSLKHPFIPRHLQLVEFSEIRLDSQPQPLEEEMAAVNALTAALEGTEIEGENFYEELDNYGKNRNEEYAINDFGLEDDGNSNANVNDNTRDSITDDTDLESGNFLDCDDVENDNGPDPEIAEPDDENLDSSSLSSPSHANESLYSEPIYGQGRLARNPWNSSQNGSSGSHSSQNTSNPAALPPENPQQCVPLQASISDVPIHYSSKSLFNLNTQDSLYDIPFPSSQLPPVPTSAAVNKFSSIAKSAGKKLSKKLNYLRRLSRSSFEGIGLGIGGSGSSGGSSSSEFYSTLSLNQQPIYDVRPNHQSFQASSGQPAGRRTGSGSVISRPSIPPPEPPRNVPLTPVKPVTYGIPPASANANAYFDDDIDDDDSDFYDSDSELIRNFVAAVQPIYSMEEEPLYQYYTYGISLQPEANNYQPVIPKNLGLTLDMLVPRTGQRTLWCELPEVISSGILTILSDQQKKLQEAIFEILTSEVSYLKSLDVLVQLFFENDILIQVLRPEDKATLFGNITYVKDCAQTFLSELLTKWEESWYIQDVGQVINDNANNKFHVYKEYCRNKPYQDKILQKLRSTNDEFVNIIKTIEEDPKCQLLGMDSFLMLPMQRITRLPLLVNAIIQRTQSPKEKSHCEEALKSLTNLVLECNDAAKESQDAEETAAIFEKLEFPRTIKPSTFPGQFLLKGDFMKNPFDSGIGHKINWTFQKNKKTFFWLLLFANQLFITKKKSSGKFEVIDMMSPFDSNIKPLPNLEGISKDFQHFFMLHFERHETVYFLAARTQSEVERWKLSLEQLKQKKDLKVEAVFLYQAKLKDELSFAIGDVILVSQRQPDGWYYGKKMDTEESGWFPGNYCVEC